MDLAPLHNPANLSGIRAARALLGEGVSMVAVFDTAFHSTMPETSYLYAIRTSSTAATASAVTASTARRTPISPSATPSLLASLARP